jgi:hypothetical protein
VAPRRSWVNVAGKRRYYLLSDEQLALDGYTAGAVRQLSASSQVTDSLPGPVLA